jgi:hypothetical protein
VHNSNINLIFLLRFARQPGLQQTSGLFIAFFGR